MKVIVNFKEGQYSVYIPKKDIEVNIIKIEKDSVFGGKLYLENGMILYIEPQNEDVVFPKTFDAKKL